MLTKIAEKIDDEKLMDIIIQWLKVEVVDGWDFIPEELGVPQGEAVSPLFANIYLNSLDTFLEERSIHFVRYADDFIILCDSEERTKQTFSLMKDFIEKELMLRLKSTKTDYIPIDHGVDFLGFTLYEEATRIREDNIERIKNTLKERMGEIAKNIKTGGDVSEAMNRYNSFVSSIRHIFLLEEEPHTIGQLEHLDKFCLNIAPRYYEEEWLKTLPWIKRESFVLERHEKPDSVDKKKKARHHNLWVSSGTDKPPRS